MATTHQHTARTAEGAGQGTTTHQPSARQQLRHQVARDTARQARRRRITRTVSAAAALVVVALVVFGLLSARPTASTAGGPAPEFTLPTTTGGTVSLADLRGGPVLIYFNEGAGCGSCTQQMAEIEKNPGFAEAGITVLPIVMNSAEEIQADLDTFGVTTPHLLDDGTVSEAYGVLGAGMHEGLPGHGFVLVDAEGTKLWHGNYPSMWLDPADLLDEATSRL